MGPLVLVGLDFFSKIKKIALQQLRIPTLHLFALGKNSPITWKYLCAYQPTNLEEEGFGKNKE